MTRRVVIRPEADVEMESAVRGLELARASAGRRLAQMVETVLERIEQFPEMYAKIHREVRAVPIRRYHYVLYYRVTPELIDVIALTHSSRDLRLLWKRFES